jgi:hypothetical protein
MTRWSKSVADRHQELKIKKVLDADSDWFRSSNSLFKRYRASGIQYVNRQNILLTRVR